MLIIHFLVIGFNDTLSMVIMASKQYLRIQTNIRCFEQVNYFIVFFVLYLRQLRVNHFSFFLFRHSSS